MDTDEGISNEPEMTVDTQEAEIEIVQNKSGERIVASQEKIKNRSAKIYEKLVQYQGMWYIYAELNETQRLQTVERDNRFKGSFTGELIVTARLKQELSTSNKKINSVKIMSQIVRDKIKHARILDNNFTAIDIVFNDIVTANLCLDLQDSENRVVMYTIGNRNRRYKGVITCWDGKLTELGEAIDDKHQIYSIERLRKRVYDDKKKEFVWDFTKHSVITMQITMKIYGGITIIPVRPFVDPVMQCFQCYGFDQWRDKCKKDKTCVVCGEAFHCQCNKPTRCTNCKGNHKANSKKCEYYQRKLQQNKMMVEENLTGYEAIQRMTNIRAREREKQERREQEHHDSRSE